jgi:hypothetical protein
LGGVDLSNLTYYDNVTSSTAFFTFSFIDFVKLTNLSFLNGDKTTIFASPHPETTNALRVADETFSFSTFGALKNLDLG